MSSAHVSSVENRVRMPLANMIFSGVFERYPGLQVGFIEVELCWAPHFLDRIDYNYTNRPFHISRGHRFQETALLKDFPYSNVFPGFQEDSLGVRDRDIIGMDKLHWGSDDPHQESIFPKSRKIIDERLYECTEMEKANIAGANCAKVCGLS